MQNLVSHHYNWQDNRCSPEFLSSLPKPDSHLSIHTGYGCCTLFWLAKYSPKTIESMDCASTIADFLVAILCDLDVPKMSPQSAASWGYFNTELNEWNRNILESAHFPIHLLPDIAKAGTLVGTITKSWYSIPSGVSVGVALGDLQGSVFAALSSDNHAMCNISTSAQLVFVAKNFHPQCITEEKTMAKIVPYIDGKYLFEAAALNGGNAISLFVSNLHKFIQQVINNNSIDENTIWKFLIESCDESSESDLEFSPTFLGERHCPHVRASIMNMKTDNSNIIMIFRALCKGVIANIRSMASPELLKEKQITKIIATGSALLRNKVLQMELERQYSIPIECTRAVDSPMGAALLMIETLNAKRM